MRISWEAIYELPEAKLSDLLVYEDYRGSGGKGTRYFDKSLDGQRATRISERLEQRGRPIGAAAAAGGAMVGRRGVGADGGGHHYESWRDFGGRDGFQGFAWPASSTRRGEWR